MANRTIKTPGKQKNKPKSKQNNNFWGCSRLANMLVYKNEDKQL